MTTSITKFTESNLRLRLNEILFLRGIINNYKNTDSESTTIRSWIVMLYAHWEWFIKDIASKYIDEIKDLDLSINLLLPWFLALFFDKIEGCSLFFHNDDCKR